MSNILFQLASTCGDSAIAGPRPYSPVPVVTFLQTIPVDIHHLAFRQIGKHAAQAVEKELPGKLRELERLSEPLVGRHPSKRL